MTFGNVNVFKSHYSSKKHLKIKQRIEQEKQLTENEFQEKMICIVHIMNNQHMKQILQNTIDYQNMKFSKTSRDILLLEERLKQESEESEILESEEIENEIKQNESKPKKQKQQLPLGDDGESIPLWLYKYRGLNTEYRCEICGNKSYAGRRNYEKHFHQSQHLRGLKCLGITPSIEFFDICRINDAIALNKKLQQMKKESEFDVENDEEMEDAEGNVLLKKDYIILSIIVFFYSVLSFINLGSLKNPQTFYKFSKNLFNDRNSIL